MEYIEGVFRQHSPNTYIEVVDASLEELVKTCRRAFIWIGIHSTIGIPTAFIYYLIAKAILSNISISIPIFSMVFRLAIWVGPILIALYVVLRVVKYYVSKVLSPIRDQKVVNRVIELVSSDYSVLIIRGREHVNYLKEELEIHGIHCEVLNTS